MDGRVRKDAPPFCAGRALVIQCGFGYSGGAGGAYGTYWLASPQEDMVIVMRIQQIGRQLKLSEDFNSLVYQAIDD